MDNIIKTICKYAVVSALVYYVGGPAIDSSSDVDVLVNFCELRPPKVMGNYAKQNNILNFQNNFK